MATLDRREGTVAKPEKALAPAPTKAHRRHNPEALTWRNVRNSWRAYALLSPFLLLLVVFLYYPPLLGLIGSFYVWAPTSDSTYVGLRNFQEYLAYPETLGEIKNMLLLLGMGLVSNMVFPFVMAELIFNLRSRSAKRLYRSMAVIPLLVPGIVVTLLWNRMYDPVIGPINVLLRGGGLAFLAQDWLGDPWLAIYSIAGIRFPWVASVATLIFLGGLGQISDSIYDAALLDGSTGLHRVLFLDLPLVLGQVRLLMILAVIGALTSFDSILVLTQGGPGFATSVPALTMYQRAFRTNQFGYASAIGLMLFVLAMGFTLLINRFVRPFREEER